MKKSIYIVFLSIFFCITPSVASISLELSGASVKPGGTVTITLSMTNSVDVGGFEFIITPDPTEGITFDSVWANSRASGYLISNSSFGAGQKIIAIAFGTSISAGSGEILSFKYSASSSATPGTIYYLTLSEVKVLDLNRNVLAVETTPGTITVEQETPILQVSPYELNFLADYGGNPASQSFYISNGGGGTLSWSITCDSTWLSVSLDSGTGVRTVRVNITSSNLSSGKYNTTITVTASGVTGSPKTIHVSLVVYAEPTKTTAADLYRCTFLWFEPVGITPTNDDYNKYDLDQNGYFEFGDLDALLDSLKRSSNTLPPWDDPDRNCSIYVTRVHALPGGKATVEVFATTETDKDYWGADVVIGFDSEILSYEEGSIIINPESWNPDWYRPEVIIGNGLIRVVFWNLSLDLDARIHLSETPLKLFSVVLSPSRELSIGDSTTIYVRGLFVEVDEFWNADEKHAAFQNGEVIIGSPPESKCDFNGDGNINIADVIALLIFMRDNPGDLGADFNGDGSANIADAIAMLLAHRDPTTLCPDGLVLLASAVANNYLQVTRLESLTEVDIKYIQEMMISMKLTEEEETAFYIALYGKSGRSRLQKAFSLNQNSPNPFNPFTSINYIIHESSSVLVTLKIYDLRGNLLRTLVSAIKDAGSYNVFWDGKDEAGRQLSSGVYLYRMQARDFVQTRKMVLLK